MREDSADADLFKLLIQDLSMGHVIRQHRRTDGAGNFLKEGRHRSRSIASPVLTSAFEDGKPYELTALGQQFVHYAMTETTVKIEYHTTAADGTKENVSNDNGPGGVEEPSQRTS